MENDGFNSKYSGEEVEALLDQVASGGGGGGNDSGLLLKISAEVDGVNTILDILLDSDIPVIPLVNDINGEVV